jgi:predicted ester cyclase
MLKKYIGTRCLETFISQDNKVVFVGNVTGTHKGNFFFIPPTGNKISYQAVHIHKIEKDRNSRARSGKR